MKVNVFIQINGKINSRELYENICHFGNINVTDCGENTLVYGECYLEQASRVFFHASLYGDVSVTLTHTKEAR